MDKKEKTPKAVAATAAPKVSKIETYDISNSADTMHLAVDVAKFIKENKLYQNIQGKEFVNVEGWQYAGSRLGIFPIIEVVQRMQGAENEIIYEAKATLLNTRSGQTVGAGQAVCSNKENGKKYYQEFAIASMAQTRAIGKGFRNMLAWVIRAAGYEPTPAEEMDYAGNTPAQQITGSADAVKITIPQNNTEPKPANAAPPALPSETKKAATTKAATAPAADQSTKIAIAEAPNHSANEAAAAEDQTNDAEVPQVKYATAKQKEEIIRLLNSVVITRQEKTKMLLNINRLDEERAAQSIKKLRQVIEEREAQTQFASANPSGSTTPTGATVKELPHSTDFPDPEPNIENQPVTEALRMEMRAMVKKIKYPAKAEAENIKKIDSFKTMGKALEFKALLQEVINQLES